MLHNLSNSYCIYFHVMGHVYLPVCSPMKLYNELNLLTAAFKLLEHLNPLYYLCS